MEIKNKIQQLIRYQKIKHWYEKYEHILMPATLVLGVIIDSLTFTRINATTVFILLGIYLVISGVAILFLSVYTPTFVFQNRVLEYIRLLTPLILQFTFGALLSAVFIFYFFSGTVFVSWPFIFLLVLLMVSNDVFRRYYLKPLVQVSVYFFIVFSCLSIILPFVFNSLNIGIFVWSGMASLTFIALYIYVLIRFAPEIKKQLKNFVISILAIFVFINSLYFLNSIPPIPLSIREVTLSHGVVRNSTGYILQVEEQSVWHQLIPGQIVHKAPGEGISVFTTIFAPKSLSTKIIHHWQWYDSVKSEWVTKNRLPFVLTGGRKDGFRGYSTKTNVPFGEWRVDVETERGQVLGRVKFDVEPATGQLQLQEVIK